MPNLQGPGMEVVHLLRAATVELALHSARFASRNGMHPTDVRALIALMDASRAGEEMTAGRLGAGQGGQPGQGHGLQGRSPRHGIAHGFFSSASVGWVESSRPTGPGSPNPGR